MSSRATRRRFTAVYKKKILDELDALAERGEVGALLRREGLYSSHVTSWRAERRAGELSGLEPEEARPEAEGDEPPREGARGEGAGDRAPQSRERQARPHLLGPKKSLAALGGDAADDPGRRREQREQLMTVVAELAPTVGIFAACAALALARATYYRARTAVEASSPRVRRVPRALSDGERKVVAEVLHEPRFVDLAPAEVVATLLDEGRFVCSERLMYRILAANREVRERRDQLRHPHHPVPQLLTERPNQLWSWDITKLLGPQKWSYFYLYVILDVYSRYVVGWMVATRERASLAKKLIEATCRRQGIDRAQLTLHADRGSSMKSKPVALLLADLGVTKTHSRPHVSNDNPFSEAHFKTLKYRPDFPDRFEHLEHARAYVANFIAWYNDDHRHGGLGLLTPHDVHHGRVDERLAHRRRILDAAFDSHPERFPRGRPTPLAPPAKVWINPPRADITTAASSP